MFCPRLDHFVRLNPDGTVGKCGHMVNPKGFETYGALHSSEWLSDIKETMEKGKWPDECVRCQRSEKVKGESVRTKSIDRHKILYGLRKDYLIVGGVLDNICNSACQTCSASLSTKLGSLESRNYPRVDNHEVFKKLPLEKVIELDVSGGEPTASKNYKEILNALPENVRIVRMNTNGSRMIDEIEKVLKQNVTVIITLSLDGIANTHDYIRWPIKWEDYTKSLDCYLDLQKTYRHLHLDMWTTVSCFNIATLQDIVDFAKSKDIPHDWAFLNRPSVLDVRYKNKFTNKAKHTFPGQVAIDKNNTEALESFIERQDNLRKININDYFSF
jgi:sulfatase maturation enzyme AslB (radical SAM superfamily)